MLNYHAQIISNPKESKERRGLPLRLHRPPSYAQPAIATATLESASIATLEFVDNHNLIYTVCICTFMFFINIPCFIVVLSPLSSEMGGCQ